MGQKRVLESDFASSPLTSQTCNTVLPKTFQYQLVGTKFFFLIKYSYIGLDERGAGNYKGNAKVTTFLPHFCTRLVGQIQFPGIYVRLHSKGCLSMQALTNICTMKGYYGDLRTWGTRSSPKNTWPPTTNVTGTVYYEQANKSEVNPIE